MAGRYFEEFAIGEILHHELRRTITEADNILFCSITMNPQPLHIDYAFAAESTHGRPLVNGLYTLGLMMGLTVIETTLGTTEGNLGFKDLNYLAPVYYGDTIRAESEVLDKRISQSKPGLGIVTLQHRALNQRDEVVLSCTRAGLIRCRSASREM